MLSPLYHWVRRVTTNWYQFHSDIRVTQLGERMQSDTGGRGIVAETDLKCGNKLWDCTARYYPGEPPVHLQSDWYLKYVEGYFLLRDDKVAYLGKVQCAGRRLER